MLVAYFDETGHADDPILHFVGMAGFVAPSAAWINFESEWQDTLRKAGLKEAFHMKDFAHSAGQFAEWKGQEEKRQLLFGRLIEIIRETNAKPIGAAVSLRDYKTLTEAQRSQFRNPYYLVSQICTRGAADRAVFELPGEGLLRCTPSMGSTERTQVTRQLLTRRRKTGLRTSWKVR